MVFLGISGIDDVITLFRSSDSDAGRLMLHVCPLPCSCLA
jgi:hypothetical protein